MQQQEEVAGEYDQYAEQYNQDKDYWENYNQAANYYNNQGEEEGEGEGEGGEGGGERLLEDQENKYYYHYRYQNAQEQQQEKSYWQQKKQQQQQQEQQVQNSKAMSPSWYNMLGGKLYMYNGLTSSAATPFVYAWSLLIFVALIAYGAYAIYSKHSLFALAFAMFMHLQASLMLLLLLPQGILPTPEADGSLSDPYAFYNSASMLMVYTFFSYILFDIIAFVLFGGKTLLEKSILGTSPHLGEPEAEDLADIEDGLGKDYRKYDSKLVIQ